MALGVWPAWKVVDRGIVADEDWLAVMLTRESAVGFTEMRETEIWVADEVTLPVADTVPPVAATLEVVDVAAWRASSSRAYTWWSAQARARRGREARTGIRDAFMAGGGRGRTDGRDEGR